MQVWPPHMQTCEQTHTHTQRASMHAHLFCAEYVEVMETAAEKEECHTSQICSYPASLNINPQKINIHVSESQVTWIYGYSYSPCNVCIP